MTQTTTAPEPTRPAAGRGFPLPCLKCGERTGLSLRVDALDEDDAVHCPDCDADYSLADARQAVAAWSALLAWVEMAPLLTEV